MTAQIFLILDDSQNERHILASVLSDAFPRATIHQTGDTLEAMRLYETLSLECVLLDYNMPQMDGVTFAGKLRAQSRYLPLVLVTGAGDEMLVSHAMRSGISDYIPKARVSVASLQRTVERAILSCNQSRIIEEQREELENFAYALAHDFKQPIRQIRTFAQLISDDLQGVEFDGVKQHLDFLNHAARRLSELVDVMSQYTLLNQPAALGAVQLGSVIDEVRAALATFLSERGGQLTFTGNQTLHGNSTLLAQVIQNLVVNGLKYNTSPVPRVDISASARDGLCTIAVRDNGFGIEAQYLDEIFRPLVRLHTAKEYAGTGLGLTLARKAVLSQNGSIWCESEPGSGSTFYVGLPVRAQ